MFDKKLADAYFEIYLKSDKFKSGTHEVQFHLNSLMESVTRTALGFTGGMGLITAIEKMRNTAIGAVQDYAKFQSSMKEVSTLVDTQRVNMDNLGGSIVTLSNKYGKDKNGLAGALYETISAGVDAADSIKFLDVAVKAAIGGVTDTKTVVDGLTSALNAYGFGVDKAEMVSDALFTTVKVGKTRMDELSGAIGTVAPIANAAGLSIDELGSAIATLTLSGLSTTEAATALRSMLNNIIKPGDQAREIAERLGIQLDVTALKTQGFSKWLEDLRNKTGGSSTALALLLPDVQGLNGAIQLTGEGFNRFNSTMDEMAKKAGATQDAADKLEGSLSRLWETAVTGTKNAFSNGTDASLPLLEWALKRYNNLIKSSTMSDAEAFEKMLSTRQKARLDPNMVSNEQLEQLIFEEKSNNEYRKALQEQSMTKDIRGNPLHLPIYQKEINQANEFIAKMQQVIDTRINEEGTNKRIFEEQQERQRQAEEASKKAAAAKEEETKKALEAARKKAEAEAVAIKNEQKNKEESEENSRVLKQIANDKIHISERIASLQESQAIQEVQLRKDTVASVTKYNKQVYESQVQQNEDIVNNERYSAEERIKANEKLFDVKKDMLEIERKEQINAINYVIRLERMRVDQANAEIDRYMSKLKMDYDENVNKIKESTLLSKEEKENRIRDLGEDLNKRLSNLGVIKFEYEKAFLEFEGNGKQAAINISKSFDNQIQLLINSTEHRIKALSDAGKEEEANKIAVVSDSVQELYSTISKAISLHGAKSTEVMSAIVNDVQIKFKKVQGIISSIKITPANEKSLGKLAETLGKIGEVADFAIPAANGLIGAVQMFIDDTYGAEEKAKEEVRKRNELYNNMFMALDMAIIKTKEWLKALGEEDISNVSYNEIELKKQDLWERRAQEINTAIGTDLTGDQVQILRDFATKKRDIGAWSFAMESYYDENQGISIDKNKSAKITKDYNSEKQKIESSGSLNEAEKNKQLNDLQYQYMQDVFPYLSFKDRADVALEMGLVSQEEYEAFKVWAAGTKDKPDSNGEGNLFDDTFKEGLSPVAQEQWNRYDQEQQKRVLGQSGIDHTKSMDKKDFIADLESEKSSGTISEEEYYKALYLASNIPGSYNWSNGDSTWDFDEIEKEKYKTDYFNYVNSYKKNESDSGHNDIIGQFADGGIALSPMLATLAERGKPEAIVPFDRMEEFISMFMSNKSSTQVIRVEIENKIDPNIPITQDSAKVYSQQIGNRIETVLRSKGLI